MTTSQEHAERIRGWVPRDSDRVRLPISTERIDDTNWLVWRGDQAVGEIHRLADGQYDSLPYAGQPRSHGRNLLAAIASFG